MAAGVTSVPRNGFLAERQCWQLGAGTSCQLVSRAEDGLWPSGKMHFLGMVLPQVIGEALP